MIYVFRTEKLYTTTNTELLKKRKNYIVVDATGTKYVETGAQNHTVRYRLPYLWSWKEEDEVAVFIDNYGDVIRKEDLDFWKLDIYLDEDNCYQSHSKTEYCWGTIAGKIKALEEAGYKVLGHFILPDDCWLDNYYNPLLDSHKDFMEKFGDNEVARVIVERDIQEADFYKKYKDYYSYGFYIAQKL